MQEPFDSWIPGVLNRNQMKALCEHEHFVLTVPFNRKLIDESSIDLHLTTDAYRMVNGSVKPSREFRYTYFLKQGHLAEKISVSSSRATLLKAKSTYVFRLREQLGKGLGTLGIFGQATAKSSVGRVDVLARLIVDGMDTYECFKPKFFNSDSFSGEMYLEITPITFDVLVRSGISLSQLRLFYGDPDEAEVRGEELYSAVYSGSKKQDGSLTVDISNTNIGGLEAAAFYAEPSKDHRAPVPLWTSGRSKNPMPDPTKYWKLKQADGKGRLKIESEKFYILRSKERICVPPGIAVYCRASDETIGEMRIHYAGFVHPWWGLRRTDDTKGTPLIFEVRGHQVNVSLAHGEQMANLIFYRMSQDAPKSKPTPYEGQQLQLSKFFSPWPGKLRYTMGVEDGAVEAV
jgi:dCTP deaminase